MSEVQRLFAQLADQANDILWLVTRNWGELVFMSDAYEDVFGQSRAKLREDPRAFLEAIHPSDRERVHRALERLSNEESIDIEFRVNPAEDYGRWVWTRGGPITDDTGTITHVGGFTRDITTRKAREQELTHAKRHYEAMVEDPNILVRVLDPDGTVRDVNKTAMEYIDVDLEAVVGEPFRATPWWGKDKGLQEDVSEWVQRAAAGEYVPFETQITGSEGQRIVSGVFRPVTNEADEVTAIIVSDRDITDRKRREEILREMYGIISDRERSFREQVQALIELGRTELGTEYGTLSKIQGDDYIIDVVGADDDSIQAGDVIPVSATNCEIVASTEETLVSGDVERDAPELADRADYTDWGISCYLGAPVFGSDGISGTLCFYDTEPRFDQFSDWEVTLVDLMTRWVSYELQRQQMTERLQRQNERLENFASIVSHDLRNPLTVAEGSITLAEETGELEHLVRARNAIDRASALIDDLLVLARAGDTVDSPSSVDFRSIVAESWETIPTEEMTLEVTTERTVQADATRLQQLLENLLRNAVTHGGATVTVGDLPDGFYVEDDGPGIPPESRDDVFEYGYTTADEGTGFGLAIVQEIADAHDWRVQITEGTAGGARFEFTGVSVEE